MSGVTSNTTRRIRKGATLPAACSPGECFMKTSGGSEGLHICITANTWILLDAAAGDGTVTSVSVSSANGFAGSVANPTTTPAITLSTSITGVLKGNGTAISAAGASDLPSGIDATKLADGTVSNAELQFINSVTSNVQTQLDLKASLSPTVREITAATDTITSADNGKVIRANRATGQTLTVTGPFTAGFNCVVIQEDAGQTTFAAGGGATVINRQTHTKIAGEGGLASLVCYVADSLILGGDTAA